MAAAAGKLGKPAGRAVELYRYLENWWFGFGQDMGQGIVEENFFELVKLRSEIFRAHEIRSRNFPSTKNLRAKFSELVEFRAEIFRAQPGLRPVFSSCE